MRKTLVTAALVLAALGAGAAGQSPGPPGRTLLVTSDSALVLQAWRAGTQPGSLEQAWDARPRSVDPATWSSRRGEAVSPPRDASLVVADINGDGTNELIAVDAYGLTAYGRPAAYFAFPTVSDTGAPAFAVADVDGDGAAEVVTQRRIIRDRVMGREIEVLKIGPAGMQSAWKREYPGLGSAITIGDADNDHRPDLVSAGETLLVLQRRHGATWEVATGLPNAGSMVSSVRVGDVDKDGRNEVVAAGTSGKVTVYQHRKVGEDGQYAVLWQSRFLAADGLKAPGGGAATVSVQALAIADITGDGQQDIIAGAVEFGKLGDRDIRSPRLHVFSFDGVRDFGEVWTSDWLPFNAVSAISAGDVDGDGAVEFVVNGRQVYRRDAATGAFRATATACTTCTDGVIGTLGDLAEPAMATRVVPLYWNVPGRQIAEGQTLNVALTLLSPFAEARDVTVTVTPANARMEVKGGMQRTASIPAGGTVTLPPFSLTARAGNDPGALQVEIAVAGGYRQMVPASLMVAPPLPSYQADAEARLATALANARHENRRALIVWGSSGDTPSRDFILTMVRSGELARTLLYEYEIVRAEYAGNERLAGTYNVPRGALPHLTVLDAGGALLASEPAVPYKAAGEGAAAWNGAKLNELLVTFKPTYVNADLPFASALSHAKKEGKTLFLWFNAPW
jgi:hypothetical protein